MAGEAVRGHSQVVSAAFRCAGQRCTAISRVIVAREMEPAMAAAAMLAQEAERFQAMGGGLWLSSFKDPAVAPLLHPEFRDAIGADHILGSPAQAIDRAFREISLCPGCRDRAATECLRLSLQKAGPKA